MHIIKRPDIPFDLKVRQYNQILQRYMTMENIKKQPYELNIIEPSSDIISDETVLNGIPKKNIKSAHALWNFIKRNGKIKIAENGEVVVNGRKIYGSNIIDLVHDLSRDRKTNKPQNGIAEFAITLHDANVPLEYIVNKNRYNLFIHETDDNHDESFGNWNE